MRSPVQFETPSAAANTANNDGTKCATVTPRSATVLTRYAGSRWPSGTAMTSSAPICNGQNSSHTDTSNVTGVFCSTLSCSVRRYSSCIHNSRLTMAAWLTATPFGRPVEPEVKMTYAVSAGRSGAVLSASVTGAVDRPVVSTVSTRILTASVTRAVPSRSVVSSTTGAAVSRM